MQVEANTIMDLWILLKPLAMGKQGQGYCHYLHSSGTVRVDSCGDTESKKIKTEYKVKRKVVQ